MIHAPNHWNDNLGNLLERIMQGSMPRCGLTLPALPLPLNNLFVLWAEGDFIKVRYSE